MREAQTGTLHPENRTAEDAVGEPSSGEQPEKPEAELEPVPGRPTEGVSRFRRRAAVRRGSWEIAVEDAVGEPPRSDDLPRELKAM